ncbi:MAG: SDR family NAD(P)-dependent oxidoreductase, partial [Candidatus Binatia bacterium]
IDVLVNVAGMVIERRLGELAFEVLAQEYAVNALGPLRVTQALLPLMGAGAKIGIVTSRVGSLGENRSGGLYGYRMSKAAAASSSTTRCRTRARTTPRTSAGI